MRVFKTAWFAKAARKAAIKDQELCRAIHQVEQGQADRLGGGVFKKRISKNEYRSIILTRSRNDWFYVYLFAKKDRSNIAEDELQAFRDLADLYARKTDADIEVELRSLELLEICHDNENEI